MNTSDIADPSWGENTFVSCVIFLVGLLGITWNLLAILIVYKNPVLKNSFGLLCLSHSLANLGVLFVFFVWCGSLTALQEHQLAADLIGKRLGQINIFFWDACVYSHLAVSVNRLITISIPQKTAKILSVRNTRLILGLVWLLGALHSTPYWWRDECYFTYDPASWTWNFGDTECGYYVSIWFDYYSGVTVFLIITLLDLITFAQLKRTNRNVGKGQTDTFREKRRKIEQRFFLQTVIQGCIFFYELINFYWIYSLNSHPLYIYFTTSFAWEMCHALDGTSKNVKSLAKEKQKLPTKTPEKSVKLATATTEKETLTSLPKTTHTLLQMQKSVDSLPDAVKPLTRTRKSKELRGLDSTKPLTSQRKSKELHEALINAQTQRPMPTESEGKSMSGPNPAKALLKTNEKSKKGQTTEEPINSGEYLDEEDEFSEEVELLETLEDLQLEQSLVVEKEYALGQYSASTGYNIFRRIVPAFAVGLASLGLNGLQMVTDQMMMPYFMDLACHSSNFFADAMPWHNCVSDYNTPACRDVHHTCEKWQKELDQMPEEIRGDDSYSPLGNLRYLSRIRINKMDKYEDWQLKDINDLPLHKWLAGESMDQHLLWNVNISATTIGCASWPSGQFLLSMLVAWLAVYFICKYSSSHIGKLASFSWIFCMAAMMTLVTWIMILHPPDYTYISDKTPAHLFDSLCGDLRLSHRADLHLSASGPRRLGFPLAELLPQQSLQGLCHNLWGQHRAALCLLRGPHDLL